MEDNDLNEDDQKRLQQLHSKQRRRKSIVFFAMDYDEILQVTGEKGIWHIGNILLLWLPAIASGVWVLQTSFSGTAIQNLTIALIFTDNF